MRKWMGLGMAAVLAVVVVVGIVIVTVSPEKFIGRPAAVNLSFDELDSMPAAVKMRGTAHYRALVKQRVPGNALRAEETYYVYGFFPLNDTASREIQLLVRSKEEPEDLIDFEFLEVEGYLREPTHHTVPFRTEEILSSQSDYFFAQNLLVIEAWGQRSISPNDPGEENSVPSM